MERITPAAPVITLKKEQVLPLLAAALKEDVGAKDLTSDALITREETVKADLVVRREGVVAGLPVAEWVFGLAEPKVRFKPTVRDGQKVYPGKAVAFVEGPARGVLAGERVALNFLGRLSGIATLTRAFAERVKGTGARIFDTRKTTPTLRLLERYAVAAGGGVNHRMGLFSQVLIKENHLRVVAARPPAGGVSPIEWSVARARERVQKGTVIEVEVTSIQELREALAAVPDVILLDNMRLADIQEAVRLRDAVARKGSGRPGPFRPLLEASGGITLENVRAVALAGVDRISVGALTHSAPVLDAALEVV